MKTKYMIQRHSDGLFSAGGASTPHFTPNGKVWTSLGALHGHLAQYKHSHAWPRPPTSEILYQVPEAYQDCSVVEVEITTSNPVTILDYMGQLNEKIQAKKQNIVRMKADRVRVDELRLLAQLKKKYGDEL
jgi:hypothetical protein